MVGRYQLQPILGGFRKTAGLTQADMAKRLGVTQQTYSAAERNAANMSVVKLMRALQALDVWNWCCKPKRAWQVTGRIFQNRKR